MQSRGKKLQRFRQKHVLKCGVLPGNDDASAFRSDIDKWRKICNSLRMAKQGCDFS